MAEQRDDLSEIERRERSARNCAPARAVRPAASRPAPAVQLAQAELTADRVLEVVRRGVFSDIGDYDDENNRPRSLHELTPEQRSSIASVETVIQNVAAGDGHVDYVHKLKLLDKNKLYELALKHLGLLKDHVLHTHTLVLLDPVKVGQMSDEELDAVWKAAEIAKRLMAS